MTSLKERHQKFSDLHKSGCFVMPNPWDIGTAKMMASLGAIALATTSSAHAFTLGRPDLGHVSREEALAHANDIVRATHLPVNGDLENGYGDEPDTVAETIRQAADAGLSGCSIEDTTMRQDEISYPFDLAVERVKAAVDAAKSLDQPFVFTARADGVLAGSYDIDEAIRRAKAFDEAGADMVYVPIPPSLDDIVRLCSEVNCPVNVLAAGPFVKHTKAEIAAAGARRISLGSAIARASQRVVMDVVNAIINDGDFSALAKSVGSNVIDPMMSSD